jgi:hypothetical protein
MRLALASIVVGLLWSATSVHARSLYVNNLAGDDRANALEASSSLEGGPVRTIRRALELAEAGDFIVLAPTGEPYRESITLSGGDHSGFSLQPFTIVGNGAVLDGSRPVPVEAWEGVRPGVFKYRPPRGAFYRLFVDGKPAVRRAVAADAGVLPPLGVGEWCVHQGYIHLGTGPNKLPQDFALSYAAEPVGITLYQVHHVAILDLTVQGFHTDGVNAHDDVREARLAGLILRGNGRAGLAVGGASRVEADGCLIGDNGAEQVLQTGYSALSLQLCDLLDASAPKIVHRGGRLFINGEPQP